MPQTNTKPLHSGKLFFLSVFGVQIWSVFQSTNGVVGRRSMAQKGPCSSVDPRNDRICQAEQLASSQNAKFKKPRSRSEYSRSVRPVHMPNMRSHPFETDQAGRITFVCRRRVSFEDFCFSASKAAPSQRNGTCTRPSPDDGTRVSGQATCPR